ncbi:Thiamine-phosphate synthase [Candidatus Magnetomoraceae bacterium gMMP-1]
MINKKNFFNTKKKDIYCFADNIKLCKTLLDAGAKIIQLRDKKKNNKQFYNVASEMISLVKNYDAVLIINDRVDIAMSLGADGIHIGQQDENYHKVIKQAPDNMIIGVSVTSVDQAIKAQNAGADYLGAGAVFPTSTKSDAHIIGVNTLREIIKAVNIPIVAIGGISLKNIKKVMKAGADYYAVISEINSAKDVSARLNDFFKAIKCVSDND